MIVLKAAPGLDPDNLLATLLGPGFTVVEYDAQVPLETQAAPASVLLLRDVPITASVMDAAKNLRLLQRYGQHVVGVDLDHARKKGIWVARAPVVVTQADRAVAEHAIFLMLALAKRYREGLRSIELGLLGQPSVRSLVGKTLGLVGVGKTGVELTRLAVALGMTVIGVKRTPDPELERELGFGYLRTMESLDDVLRRADYVSIHLPLEPETVGFFDRKLINTMKQGAFLINIARGPIVDQGALFDALRDGRLGGAGLDVFATEPIDPSDPILALPNVIATPHIAGATDDLQKTLARVVAENIARVRRGDAPLHLVS